jgi:putative transposase
MRYPAAEKLEIIRLVEQSHLPVRRTLAKIGTPPTTFYRWYDRFVEQGPEGLEDRPSRPSRVWNRIPEAVRDRIVTLALEAPELSPRELAVKFTDAEKYPRHGLSDQWRSHGSMSEASVYRLLKSHDLITSPAYVVIKGETLSAIGPRTMVERRVQGQDHRPQPDVADGFYLPESHRLGLVLPVHDPR